MALDSTIIREDVALNKVCQPKRNNGALEPIRDLTLLGKIMAIEHIPNDKVQDIARNAGSQFHVYSSDEWKTFFMSPKNDIDFRHWLLQFKHNPKDSAPLKRFVEGVVLSKRESLENSGLSYKKVLTYTYYHTKQKFNDASNGGYWHSLIDQQKHCLQIKHAVDRLVMHCVRSHQRKLANKNRSGKDSILSAVGEARDKNSIKCEQIPPDVRAIVDANEGTVAEVTKQDDETLCLQDKAEDEEKKADKDTASLLPMDDMLVEAGIQGTYQQDDIELPLITPGQKRMSTGSSRSSKSRISVKNRLSNNTQMQQRLEKQSSEIQSSVSDDDHNLQSKVPAESREALQKFLYNKFNMEISQLHKVSRENQIRILKEFLVEQHQVAAGTSSAASSILVSPGRSKYTFQQSIPDDMVSNITGYAPDLMTPAQSEMHLSEQVRIQQSGYPSKTVNQASLHQQNGLNGQIPNNDPSSQFTIFSNDHSRHVSRNSGSRHRSRSRSIQPADKTAKDYLNAIENNDGDIVIDDDDI